jgi:beta-glucanase (GH16 family)
MIVSDTGFHVFGIEWGPKYINYYIDDVLYNHTSRCARRMGFDHPFYIVINLAVGGSFVVF